MICFNLYDFLPKAIQNLVYMKESTKKTLTIIGRTIVTIITALLTTLGAHAAGVCEAASSIGIS